MGFKTRYDFTTGRVATVATIATQNGKKLDFLQSVAGVAEVAGGESQKIMRRTALFPLPGNPSMGEQEHGGEAEHPKPEAIRQGKRIPDHAEFCPQYWRGCFSCSSYLPPNTDAAIACGPFFCRKMNVMRFGSELVELAQI